MQSHGVPHGNEFVGWWREIEPDLLRKAMKFGLGDRARDVVQDVAVLALMHEGFSDLEQFTKWASARVYWLSLDRLQGAAKTRTNSEIVLGKIGVAPAQERSVMAEELWRGVQQLPARQRHAMKKSLQGGSTDEIARELHVTTATVRSLLRFARRALFRQLTEGEE